MVLPPFLNSHDHGPWLIKCTPRRVAWSDPAAGCVTRFLALLPTLRAPCLAGVALNLGCRDQAVPCHVLGCDGTPGHRGPYGMERCSAGSCAGRFSTGRIRAIF